MVLPGNRQGDGPMNEKNNKRVIMFVLAACIISSNSYAKQTDNPKENFVDCTLPNASLQNAIDGAEGPTPIPFVGPCLGDLQIIQDDIRLQGQAQSDEIVGEVVIEGARRTRFSNMTIGGGANGITAYDGAVLRAEDIIVTGAGGYGVGSFQGAAVVLTGVDINNNGGYGVISSIHASVEIREGSNISSNGRDGVGVFDGSYARIGGATVQNNAGYGVKALGSRVNIQKRGGIVPVISGNTRVAVDIGEGSSCRIDDATISSIGSTARALEVSRGSGCTISRSTLTSSNPAEATILALIGSGVALKDNDIFHTAAGGTALNVTQGASVNLHSEEGGNTLTGSGFAISVNNRGNFLQGYGAHDIINGEVEIYFSSHVQFLDATINGNIEMGADAILRLRNRTDLANTVVNGNVELSKDSLLEFRKGPSGNKVVVTGNVTCGDTESSVSSVGGDSHDVKGIITCTGF
jgi:hypothetical protein